MKIPQEKLQRFYTLGAVVLLVVVAAAAAMLYMRVDDLESTLAQARADSEKTNMLAAAASRKVQEQLKASSARIAELEQKQREGETLKILLGKLEPQIAPVLEAAANARAAKPEARGAALTAIGLIGIAAHGQNHDPSLGALVRALAIDKNNCVAGLAINQGGGKPIDVTPECQALLPAAAPDASKAAPAAKS